MAHDRVNLIALRDGRQRAEALISTRFAEGLIDQDELERRLEAVQDAEDLETLEDLIADLVDPGTEPRAALVPVPRGAEIPATNPTTRALALARPEELAPAREIQAIFASVQHSGDWTPARVNHVREVCGDATLDFREARLGPGETEVEVRSLFASTELVVPPGLAVRVEASAIFGDISRDSSIPERPAAPGDPVLVITGRVLFAALELHERELGESRREARQRHRAGRRARRRARRKARRARRRALPPGELR